MEAVNALGQSALLWFGQHLIGLGNVTRDLQQSVLFHHT
jgi:hypothetical protein